VGAAMKMMAAALGVALALVATVPSAAQEGLPRTVMITRHTVAPEHHDAFRQWIADFRLAIEDLVMQRKLSPIDLCAYKSWRVLGPDAAGLNEDFLFVFEPVIPIANYSLAHYLSLALPADEAQRRMDRYLEMSPDDPDVIYASPLDPAFDEVDIGDACTF
jgi:hypothetical protein